MTMEGHRSTARPGAQAFLAWAVRRLPSGLVLNVGAGFPLDMEGRLVHVDRDRRVLSGSRCAAAADALHLPFGRGGFAGAILKDVLEHVESPLAVLTEVRRVCGDGAVLSVTVPRAIPRAVWSDPTHIRGFTADALRSALSMTGWAPMSEPRRIGSVRGAGRFPWLLERLTTICRIPGIGHYLGTNWFVEARARHLVGEAAE
jgi:SAM-dependent methyltransferase